MLSQTTRGCAVDPTRTAERSGQYLQLVISASYGLLKKSPRRNHRAVPERSPPGAASRPRSAAAQSHRHQGSSRYFFTRTRRRSLASRARNENSQPVPRRRLDWHWLARHHGRRRAQRLPRRRSRPPLRQCPAKIPPARPPRHRPLPPIWICATEDEATTIAAGLWMGGEPCVLMIQHAGLFASVNTLRGVAIDGRVPPST